jgi:hypothetical protein
MRSSRKGLSLSVLLIAQCTGCPKNNCGILVILIYSLLNHRACMFKKFSAKSVQVLLTWVGTAWKRESFSHVVSDEVTFHIHGVVNRHNCRILGRWEPTYPNGACSRQPQVQRVVRHHVGPNCLTLLLPRDHHHEGRLIGPHGELNSHPPASPSGGTSMTSCTAKG